MSKQQPPARPLPNMLNNIRALVAEVSAETGIPEDDLLGSSRFPEIIEARHEMWLRARDRWELSYPRLGRLFQRDHTTVLDGCRKAQARREERAA